MPHCRRHVRGVHAALQAPRANDPVAYIQESEPGDPAKASESERAEEESAIAKVKRLSGVKTMAQATATFGDKVTSMKLGPLLKKNAPWVHRLPCTIAEWNDTLEGL